MRDGQQVMAVRKRRVRWLEYRCRGLQCGVHTIKVLLHGGTDNVSMHISTFTTGLLEQNEQNIDDVRNLMTNSSLKYHQRSGKVPLQRLPHTTHWDHVEPRGLEFTGKYEVAVESVKATCVWLVKQGI